MGILHVTRKKVVDVLTERFIQNKAMQITMQGGDPASQLGEGEGGSRDIHTYYGRPVVGLFPITVKAVSWGGAR